MTGNDICKKALTYKGYAYWYGGKGQKCTYALLITLSKLYPSIYTPQYCEKCKADIKAGRKCIDCSGLVCHCYGVPDVGTMQFDKYFTKYSGHPVNGMIVWRAAHTGIYCDGKIYEARGKDYGVTYSRLYCASDWQRVYYKKDVSYKEGNMKKVSKTPTDYLNAAIRVLSGFYGTGEARKAHVKSAGFDYEKLQKIVNAALEVKNG